MNKIFYFVLLNLSINTASAANFFVYSQFSGGGDTLAYAVDSDGSREYDQINAGGGLEFGFGGQAELSRAYGLHLRASFGFNEDELETESGDTSFKSTPIELMLLKDINDRHWLGVGLLSERESEWNFSDQNLTDIKFDDANGFALQYSYRWDFGLELGSKLRFIEYKSRDLRDLSGDGLSLYMSYHIE